MKKFKILLLIICIFLLSGCTKNIDTRTHISFSTWGSQTEIQTTKILIDKFETENPNIKIDLIHIPDNYFQKLHLLIASNLSPDIVFINNLYSKKYLNAKKFIPIDTYINNSNTLKRTDFFDVALTSFSDKGNLYAIPRDISNLVIYYNKTLFDKNKLSYPSDNWTMEEFLQTAQKLTFDKNDDGIPEVFGFGFEKNSLFWLPFLLSNGGGILDDNVQNIILDNENSTSALQFYSNLRNKYHVSPKANEQASLTTSQMFLQGKIAMHICGRWCSLTYKKNADFEWDIAKFPTGKNGSIVNSDASGWAISTSCKNKDVAWKFIEFLASNKSMDLMAKDGLILPAKKNVANSNIFLNPPPKNAKVFIEAISNSKPTPVNENYAEINDIINENFEELFNGKKNIKTTVNQALLEKLNHYVRN